MILNGQGQVAVKWVLNRAHPRNVQVSGARYGIGSQRNVHLLWVNESDLESLLNHKEKTCNCNNGTKRNAFALASRLDVGIYEMGDRHYLNPEYKEIEDVT